MNAEVLLPEGCHFIKGTEVGIDRRSHTGNELHIRSPATHSSFPVTILLQRKQLKIEGSFGKPDQCDGDHGQ